MQILVPEEGVPYGFTKCGCHLRTDEILRFVLVSACVSVFVHLHAYAEEHLKRLVGHNRTALKVEKKEIAGRCCEFFPFEQE